jgi:polyhydroxyalkanoate synthase
VEYMLNQGFNVYLLDWGVPGPEDKNTTFEDYVTEYLYRAVRKMLRVSKAKEFSVLGYCLGATLSTIYAAIYPEVPLRNMILLAAPIDFSEKPTGSMAMWLEKENLDVDRLVDTMGNVPGELIRHWAKMLKPVENFMGAYVNLLKIMHDEAAVRGWQAINRWVEDVIPFAGEAFRQFVKIYFRGNQLIKGDHVIRGRKVDVGRIEANLLNIVAEYDHLVARSQAENIMARVSSKDKTLKVVPSTHVGIMAGRSAKYKLWPEIVDWLVQRSKPLER